MSSSPDNSAVDHSMSYIQKAQWNISPYSVFLNVRTHSKGEKKVTLIIQNPCQKPGRIFHPNISLVQGAQSHSHYIVLTGACTSLPAYRHIYQSTRDDDLSSWLVQIFWGGA